MMRNFLNDWGVVIVLLLVVFVLMVGCAIIGDRQCFARASMLELDYTYKFVSMVSCRVLVNDSWIPIENYMVR